MAGKRDVIIIGGGLNGLVAAYYLAKAGFKVLILERRPVVGGGAITEEFHPGFRCSTLAHVTGPLLPKISRDMQLTKHGLAMLEPQARVCSLAPDGRALVLYQEASKSAEEIAKFSARDASRYGEFQEVVTRIASVLSELLTQTPPAIESPAAGDLLQLLRAAKNIRKLGKKNVYRLLRWTPMAVADLVSEWFDTELLRATVAARGIFGNAVGPWSAGTGAVLLMWAATDTNLAGPASFPAGGMGALTEAMSKAAREAGVEVRTNHDVGRIVIKGGEAKGVVLSDGNELAADIVVSNADPKHTLLHLVDPLHLDPSFVEKMRHYRSTGTVAKLNFALSDLPRFAGFNGRLDRSALSGRIHIGPEIDYLERAFDHSKYGEISQAPYLDISIPTISDPSLAPAQQHVMSVHMQFAPFQLKDGNWNSRRDHLRDVVTGTISSYAPNFRELILACQVITPEDLEQTYGFAGGHIFHGEFALDQLFTMRPLLGWARYRMPIRRLYLCGSGTHPGLGLNGASGLNAAREIVKDLR